MPPKNVAIDKTLNMFLNNTYNNFVTKISEQQKLVHQTSEQQKKDALLKIKEGFIKYLDEIKNKDRENQTSDFPLIQYETTKENTRIIQYMDIRIAIFYILMQAVFKNESSLPAKYKQFAFDFNTKGWPVDPNHEYFAAWLKCIKTATDAYKQCMPESDLSAWTDELDCSTSRSLSTILEEQRETAADDDTSTTASTALPSETTAVVQSEQATSSTTETPMDEVKTTVTINQPANYNFDDWAAPQQLKPLIMRIKAMHLHGCKLNSVAPKKSTAAMSLAIELFEDLKAYAHDNSRQSLQERELFIIGFQKKLHSQDDLMSTHRKQWKVIVANIAVALTGIGLFAIGISLLATGHAFFSKTKSQELVNNVDQQVNSCLSVK